MLGAKQLVVGADDDRLLGAIEASFGLIDIRGGQCDTQIVERQPHSRQTRRVGLDSDGGFLTAGDTDLTDPFDLGEFLRQACVGKILNLGQWNGARRERQSQHGRIGWIDFGIDRRIGELSRQEVRGNIDRGLHLLDSHIDIQFQNESECDDRASLGARTGHLG